MTTRSPGAFPERALWIAVFAGAGALYAAFIARSAFHLGGRLSFSLRDDAMVSMLYARNLAEGHGLTWNPQLAPVEGYSNFLWTLWIAALQALGPGDRWASAAVMASAAALLMANLLLVRAIAQRVDGGSRATALIAVALTALCYPLVYWSLRGLEVGLLAVLMSASVLALLRVWARQRRSDLLALGGALAAGVLTRDDFAVFWLLIATTTVLTVPAGARRPAALLAVGIPAVAIAGHEALRLAYYSDLLPNTYYLKLSGVDLLTRLQRGTASLLGGVVTQLYAAVVLAIAGLGARPGPGRRAGWLLLAPFAAQCAYSVYVGGDTFEIGLANRFVSPAIPLLAVLAAVGVRRLFLRGAALERRALRAAGVAFGMGAMLGSWTMLGDPVTPHLSRWLGAPVRAGWLQVAALAVLAGLCAMRAARVPRPVPAGLAARIAPAAFAAVALLTAVAGGQFHGWATRNAQHLALDQDLAAYGIALADTTAPAARIVVTAAGAPAYFSRRPSIDLLGKADRVVARRPSRSPLYWPGHTKWDYSHSVGALRPDVVAGVWGLTPADERLLTGLGYQRLAGGADLRVVGAVFVRAGSRRVDAAELDRRVLALFPAR